MKNNPKSVQTAKKNGRRRIPENRLRTGIVLLTGIAVLASVLMIAALAKPSPGNRSSLLSDSGIASDSFFSSEAVSSMAEPTVSPTPTPTLAPTAPLTPTASYDPNLPVSTARDGWSYTPGGKQGVPAKATTLHVTECDRFMGIWQGDTTKKKVYITMDCGYDNHGNTAKILDILKEKDVKVTFFVTGAMFETDTLKAVVRRMVDEGHLVGNHTWNHPSLPTMLNEKGAAAVNTELDKVEAAYLALTGNKIASYMRPPMGEFSEATMQLLANRGYRSVYWSFAYKDWDINAQMSYDDALKATKAGLHNGVVYLLHTVSDTNVSILPALIDEIRTQGYEFGLVNEIK